MVFRNRIPVKINPAVFFWTGVFLILLVSFLVFTASLEKMQYKVFFFTSRLTGDYRGEMRHIPRTNSVEENIRFFVEDLILGPISISLEPVVSKTTRLNTILLRDNVLFLDFTREIFRDHPPFSLQESMMMIEKNVKFNFPALKETVISIDGEEPQV